MGHSSSKHYKHKYAVRGGATVEETRTEFIKFIKKIFKTSFEYSESTIHFKAPAETLGHFLAYLFLKADLLLGWADSVYIYDTTNEENVISSESYELVINIKKYLKNQTQLQEYYVPSLYSYQNNYLNVKTENVNELLQCADYFVNVWTNPGFVTNFIWYVTQDTETKVIDKPVQKLKEYAQSFLSMFKHDCADCADCIDNNPTIKRQLFELHNENKDMSIRFKKQAVETAKIQKTAHECVAAANELRLKNKNLKTQNTILRQANDKILTGLITINKKYKDINTLQEKEQTHELSVTDSDKKKSNLEYWDELLKQPNLHNPTDDLASSIVAKLPKT